MVYVFKRAGGAAGGSGQGGQARLVRAARWAGGRPGDWAVRQAGKQVVKHAHGRAWPVAEQEGGWTVQPPDRRTGRQTDSRTDS